ncbi:hypothetical protein pb186bvf_008587 [Paramecium bursaria]
MFQENQNSLVYMQDHDKKWYTQQNNSNKFDRTNNTTEEYSKVMIGIQTQDQSSQRFRDKNYDCIVVVSSDSDEEEQLLQQQFINNIIKNQHTQQQKQNLSQGQELNGVPQQFQELQNPLELYCQFKQQEQQGDLNQNVNNISNPLQDQQKSDTQKSNTEQKEQEIQQTQSKFQSQNYHFPQELLNNYQEFKRFQQFLSIQELYQQNTKINQIEIKEQQNSLTIQNPQQSQIPVEQTKQTNSNQNYFLTDLQTFNQNSQQQNKLQDQQKNQLQHHNQSRQDNNSKQTKQSQNLDKNLMKQQQIQYMQNPFKNLATNQDNVEKNQNQQIKKSKFMDFSQIKTFQNYDFNESSLLKHQRRNFIVTINYSDSGPILAWFMRQYNFSLLGIIIFNFKFKYNILVIQLLDSFKIHQSTIIKEFGKCQLLQNIVDNDTISNLDKYCSLQVFMANNYHFILDSEDKKQLNYYNSSFISGKYFEFIYGNVDNVQILLNQIQKIQKWSQKSLGKQNDHTMIFYVDKMLIIYFIRNKRHPVIMKELLSQIHQPFQMRVLHENIEFSKLDEVLKFYHWKYKNIQTIIIPEMLSNMNIKEQQKQNPNIFKNLYDNIYFQEIIEKQN